MRSHPQKQKINFSFYAFAGIFTFILLWFFISYFNLIPAFFLPSPYAVIKALIQLMMSGELFKDIFASISRIFIGIILSFVVALPLGTSLATSRRYEAFFEPLVAFIRYVPPSAFIPLSIIWFGIGDVQKIIILFLGIAPYLTLLIYDAVMNMPAVYVESALTLGASSREVIYQVVLPYIMPQTWESLRIMIGSAWTYIIIAEIVGASSGLGYLIIQSQRFLKTDQIFATIIVIGLLGLITDFSFKWSYRYLFPWTAKSHA